MYDFAGLARLVRALPPGTVWRHNQAGDLPTRDQRSIDLQALKRLIAANRGRRGYTYTHYDVVDHSHNQACVREANAQGFAVNLSADTLDEADALADANCGPVTVVVPADQMTNTTTPAGRKVVICPARVRDDVNCATCRLCAIPDRRAIIAFPALGPARTRKLH
ncbi:hypothetical protein P1X14_03445 [Sphingomonas sp. AOB5]|uniref:DUF7227 family protein n=1 Tax=Sphingomonas sp. AOB5 TaxID=3034017 RepID=UPI0023F8457D|nr:hypothetical protein [Sphingomonas sp. AOB5]MDF7774292.1 hypothetical protein [Sphingomonas sp. AOB5]